MENVDFCSDGNCKLNSGTIFLKENDIISGDVWTLALTVEIQDFTELLNSLETILDFMSTKQKYSNTSIELIPQHELSNLNNSISIIKEEVGAYEDMLPKHKAKRGLVNFVGSGIKFLFGNPDAVDLENLNAKIEGIHGEASSVVHLAADQLTYIKQLDNELKNNMETIKVLAETFGKYIKLSLELAKKFNQLEHIVKHYIKMASVMREIESSINTIKKELLELRQGLDAASMGHLSVLLVSPKLLSKILEEVVHKLSNDLSLITPTDVEHVYIYYQIARTHAISTKNGIRLFIEIPLNSVDRHFELFSIKPLPFYHEELRGFISLNINEKYLMVSENRMRYALPDAEYLAKCRAGPYTICPADLPLYNFENNCPIAVFQNNIENVAKYCQQTIYPYSYEPILYRAPNRHFWVYSLSSPIKITWKCLPKLLQSETDTYTEIKTEMINGTGILRASKFCTIYSEKFILLPHLSGSTRYTVTSPIVHVPNITNVYSKEIYESKFINVNNIDKDVKHIVTTLSHSYKPINLDNAIKDINEFTFYKSEVDKMLVDKHTTVVKILFIIIILLLLWKFRRELITFIIRCCSRVRSTGHLTPAYDLQSSRIPTDEDIPTAAQQMSDMPSASSSQATPAAHLIGTLLRRPVAPLSTPVPAPRIHTSEL